MLDTESTVRAPLDPVEREVRMCVSVGRIPPGNTKIKCKLKPGNSFLVTYSVTLGVKLRNYKKKQNLKISFESHPFLNKIDLARVLLESCCSNIIGVSLYGQCDDHLRASGIVMHCTTPTASVPTPFLSAQSTTLQYSSRNSIPTASSISTLTTRSKAPSHSRGIAR